MKKSFLSMSLAFAAMLFSPLVFAASYDVPVDSPGQTEYAHFEIQNFSMKRDDKNLALHYDLPLDVTGVPNTIQIQGKLDGSNLVKLEGQNARAVCNLSESTCRIRYENLKIDSNLIEARLKALNLPAAEFSARLAVAMQFRADPIGFLKFP